MDADFFKGITGGNTPLAFICVNLRNLRLYSLCSGGAVLRRCVLAGGVQIGLEEDGGGHFIDLFFTLAAAHIALDQEAVGF